MEAIENLLMKKLQNIKSIKASFTTEDDVPKYECNVCKDMEFIVDRETNVATPCKCREIKRNKKILESSGISEAFRSKSFRNFITRERPEVIGDAKKMAIEYVRNFPNLRYTENNSIALLGEVGAGKTHLCVAMANELMKRGIGVVYMQYREDITKIKQCAKDEMNYQKAINRYKSAQVLLIDDLFKGAIYQGKLNDADLRAMFEIVNYRYFKKSPMIISSEYIVSQIIDYDPGLGSRIVHMCKGHIIEFKTEHEEESLNYRLK